MIRRLRRRHLWILVVLGIAVGVLFVAALAVRPDRVFVESLPANAEQASPTAGGQAP